MKKPAWEIFFRNRLEKIFTEKSYVLDIGGGLRAAKGRGSRYDEDREWLKPFLAKADYKILDPVDTYKPDIVGDIHNLPFGDDSQEAIICIAVLEHVENPIRAFEEMYRVLKSGGYLFVYAPFLYYYHAEKGYYKDYWRFTEDALRHLSEPFSYSEIEPIRGALETWLKLSPFGRFSIFQMLGRFLDKITGKMNSKQVSGYNLFLIK